MKKLKFTLWFSFFSLLGTGTASAQQRIVMLQHNGTSTPFRNVTTALADAYAAAENGDTIYLPGGSFSWPGEIAKKITVYGAGTCPDSTKVTTMTYVNGMRLNSGAEGSHFEGLYFTGEVGMAENASIDDIVIARCWLNSSLNFNSGSTISYGLMLINNILCGQIHLKNVYNTLVANCILCGGIEGSFNNTFINNYISGGTRRDCYYGSCDTYFIEGDANILENNVINVRTEYIEGIRGTSNVFRNNAFSITEFVWGTNTIQENNWLGITPSNIFVNVEGSNHDTWAAFKFTNDYHLVDESAYTGTDNKQIGLYGGLYPWREGLMPLNPHIRLNSSSDQVDAEGKLQINIHVGAQQ
ncbi:MAG: hypothetical protein IJS08_18950 [Victivallales bacterium]|nr:hypothetical protein [Victivallales bacterium]